MSIEFRPPSDNVVFTAFRWLGVYEALGHCRPHLLVLEGRRCSHSALLVLEENW